MTAKKSPTAPKAIIGRPTEWTPELGQEAERAVNN